MKKTLFLFCILLAVMCSGCGKSAKEKLTGTWKIKSIEGFTLSANEIETVLALTADGKFTSKTGSGEQSSGTWALSDGDKKVTATFAEGDSSVWNIVSLDEKLFVYTVDEEPEKITLEKQ